MNKLLLIILSVISLSVFAQKQEPSKKAKEDSLTIDIPTQTQQELSTLQKQMQKFNNPDWVREQVAITGNQYNAIVRTLLLTRKVDLNKIDWSKSKINTDNIIVFYLQETEETKKK